MFGFAYGVISVAIGCKHPLMRYLPPLASDATVALSLPHPETERQWTTKDFWSYIFGNRSVASWE